MELILNIGLSTLTSKFQNSRQKFLKVVGLGIENLLPSILNNIFNQRFSRFLVKYFPETLIFYSALSHSIIRVHNEEW